MIEEIKLYPAVELNLNKYVGLELRKTLPLFFPGKIAEKSGKPQREQRGGPIRQDHVSRGSPPAPVHLCVVLAPTQTSVGFVIFCQLSDITVRVFSKFLGCQLAAIGWSAALGCSSTCLWRVLVLVIYFVHLLSGRSTTCPWRGADPPPLHLGAELPPLHLGGDHLLRPPVVLSPTCTNC